MDIEKLKKRCGYDGKPQQWQYGFDLACRELAKAQAVPEWIDYTKQSPRINGRYQIFISGEQLVADWESPYGFSSVEDGVAFIQDLITHWSALVPNPQEPDND